MTSYELNDQISSLVCLRCDANYDLDDEQVDAGIGCPACLEEGFPVSLKIDYQGNGDWQIRAAEQGMKRYVDRLPYLDYPSIGEGMTSLVEIPELAHSLGLAKLWVKNEGQNPTGSHKDRMSALAVARAASLGRKSVVAASSGNAGASLAAYAAAAGMECVILSTLGISEVWSRAIKLTGAELILTETSKGRWTYLRQLVEKEGMYPVTNFVTPPVGSNPFGVQGYKTVAFEIAEQLGNVRPTVIIVPTSRGDLLWGIWQGFLESRATSIPVKQPRLFAIEPVARLSSALKDDDYRTSYAELRHSMTSIGGTSATYQSVLALQDSHGGAIEVLDSEAKTGQRELARQGLYVELSSAASLAGLRGLIKRGDIRASDRVVLVATSHGYKDPPIA